MKKLSLLVLLGLVSMSFATFTPQFKATIVNSGIAYPLASGTNLGFDTTKKSYLWMTSQVSDATALTAIIFFEPTNTTFYPDYIFLDTKTDLGTFRFGTQRLGVLNYFGGLNRTSRYCAKAEYRVSAGAAAISYVPNMGDLKTRFMVSGAAGNNTKMFGAIVNTKVADMNVAGYTKMNIQSGSIALGGDINLLTGPISVVAQAYTETVTEYTYAGFTGIMDLGVIKPYINSLLALGDKAKTNNSNAAYNIDMGIDIPVSKELKINAEIGLQDGVNDPTVSAGVQFDI